MTGLLQTVKPVTAVKTDGFVAPTQQKIGNKTITPIPNEPLMSATVMPRAATVSDANLSKPTVNPMVPDLGVNGPIAQLQPLNTVDWSKFNQNLQNISPNYDFLSPSTSQPKPHDFVPLPGPVDDPRPQPPSDRDREPLGPVDVLDPSPAPDLLDYPPAKTPKIDTSNTGVDPREPIDRTATPQTQVTQDVADVARPDSQIAEMRDSASVENRLNSLLDSESRYIQAARQRAAEQAAARGLRNSTLGMEAGERAAIESALPIAQQDAQQDFTLQRDGVQQNYQLDNMGYEAGLNQARDANLNQNQLQRDRFAADLQRERDQLMYQQQIGVLDRQQQLRLQELEYSARLTERRDQLLSQLDSNLMTQQHAQQLEVIQREFENKMAGLSFEMSHQNRQAYTNAAYQTQIAAMEQIAAIYNNPEMSPEQQRNAVEAVYRNLRQALDSLASIYDPLPGVDFDDEDVGGGGGGNGGGGGGPFPRNPTPSPSPSPTPSPAPSPAPSPSPSPTPSPRDPMVPVNPYSEKQGLLGPLDFRAIP